MTEPIDEESFKDLIDVVDKVCSKTRQMKLDIETIQKETPERIQEIQQAHTSIIGDFICDKLNGMPINE